MIKVHKGEYREIGKEAIVTSLVNCLRKRGYEDKFLEDDLRASVYNPRGDIETFEVLSKALSEQVGNDVNVDCSPHKRRCLRAVMKSKGAELNLY